MPQQDILRKAARDLVGRFMRAVEDFSLDEFLKAGVDPFRFSFNVAILGIEKATEKEIEHKLAMKLENMIGDFHENYLGNVEHKPTGSKWEKVPQGTIPGVDIKNTKIKAFLQIKSKHNSMNSSSSKRLADELGHLKERIPDAHVGCGWVIASERRSCIGEPSIAAVGETFKGRKLFAFVTGEQNELDGLIGIFPEIVKEEAKGVNYDELLRKASIKIYKALEAEARRHGLEIIKFLYNNAVGEV